jgi:hypothetical protein
MRKPTSFFVATVNMLGLPLTLSLLAFSASSQLFHRFSSSGRAMVVYSKASNLVKKGSL